MDETREVLQHMMQTEGWEIVERFINGRIEDHKSQLLHCPLEKVEEHRNKIQAYQSITTHINEHIEAAQN